MPPHKLWSRDLNSSLDYIIKHSAVSCIVAIYYSTVLNISILIWHQHIGYAVKKRLYEFQNVLVFGLLFLFSWQQHVFTCMIGELHRIDRVDFKAQHLAVTQVKHKYILTCIVEGKLQLILFCKGSGSRFILRMQLVKQSVVLCITSLNYCACI